MSNLRQAAQQALEALERGETKLRWAAITALRAALAEPEQEPLSLNNGRLTQYPDGSIGVGTPAEPEQEPQTTHWEGCEAVHPECKVTPRKPVELTDGEILAANYADGEEADPIIAAPDSELIAFSRAVMAVQRDKEGKPMAHWHGLIEPQKDATAPTPRKPLTDEQMRECAQAMNAEPLAEGWPELIKFARAIENKHGIGEQHE